MLRTRDVMLAVLCLGVATANRAPMRWVRVTGHADWSPGYSFTAVGLRDTLRVLGHREGNWHSTDGNRWLRDSSGDESKSLYNAYVVLGDAIYAIGGADDQSHPTQKSVWKSTDGHRWQLLTDHPAWSARVWHNAVARGDRIWAHRRLRWLRLQERRVVVARWRHLGSGDA